MKAYLILTGVISSAILVGCGLAKDDGEVPDGGFNLFTVEQDRQLGMQVAQEIESNPMNIRCLIQLQT